MSNGGHEAIFSGGTLAGATVDRGGTIVVFSGGAATGTTVNIAVTIDLAGLPFGRDVSAILDTSGYLTLTEAGQTATLQLAEANGATGFVLAPDRVGGTLPFCG